MQKKDTGRLFREILLTRVFESRPRAAIFGAGCVFLIFSIVPSFLIAKTGSWDWSPLFVIGGIVAGLAAGPAIGVLCVVAQTSLFIAFFALAFGALPQHGGVIPPGVLIHILIAAIMGYLSAMNLFLRKTMRELNTLRGILPICASCKKIRDDQGYWHHESSINSGRINSINSGLSDKEGKE
jgi:hypothetical protein